MIKGIVDHPPKATVPPKGATQKLKKFKIITQSKVNRPCWVQILLHLFFQARPTLSLSFALFYQSFEKSEKLVGQISSQTRPYPHHWLAYNTTTKPFWQVPLIIIIINYISSQSTMEIILDCKLPNALLAEFLACVFLAVLCGRSKDRSCIQEVHIQSPAHSGEKQLWHHSLSF